MTTAEGCVWLQREISIPAKKRGCHLISDEFTRLVPEIEQIKIGLANVHIKHTSASLCLNENWDSDVRWGRWTDNMYSDGIHTMHFFCHCRVDMESMLNKLIPDSTPFRHKCEGPDDMPAHIKTAFIGTSLSIPITEGKLNLGTWQGIWLCEHRDHAGKRNLVVTMQGAPMKK